MSNVPAITDETFTHEIEHHRGLALVDFGAAWCPPCRLIEPIVEALAAEYAGVVKVGAVDVDANPRVSARFAVRNLPTLLLFRDGQLVDRIVGAVPRSTIVARLTAQLGAARA